MKDTVKTLLESTVIPEVDKITKNRLAYNSLSRLQESACTNYTPQKVIVNRLSDNKYVIEFTGNIERLMRDQEVEITEAMEMVAAINDIEVSECVLLLDEAAINILDINKVLELQPEFAMATK